MPKYLVGGTPLGNGGESLALINGMLQIHVGQPGLANFRHFNDSNPPAIGVDDGLSKAYARQLFLLDLELDERGCG